MTTDLLGDVQLTKKHLLKMITKEKSFGEFFLAAVVQDSLMYNLHQHADSQNLLEIAYKAAQVSVQSAIETMGLNDFVVSEAIRGVMHSMVSLGGNPVEMAMATAVGGWTGIESVIRTAAVDYAGAIATGITTAVADLGLEQNSFQRVTSYVVANTVNSTFSDRFH